MGAGFFRFRPARQSRTVTVRKRADWPIPCNPCDCKNTGNPREKGEFRDSRIVLDLKVRMMHMALENTSFSQVPHGKRTERPVPLVSQLRAVAA